MNANQSDLNAKLRSIARTATAREVAELLDAGADVDCTDPTAIPPVYRYTPLRIASTRKDPEGAAVVRLLLSHGANVNYRDEDFGSTPLHKAAEEGNVEIAKLLLEAGADPTIRDSAFNSTPNDYAVGRGHAEVARLLGGRRSSAEPLVRVPLVDQYALVMKFAPRSSTNYHLVSVVFADGATLNDAKVYNLTELEVPESFSRKKITSVSVNAQQP